MQIKWEVFVHITLGVSFISLHYTRFKHVFLPHGRVVAQLLLPSCHLYC